MVTPFLLVLILGVIDFGGYMNSSQAIAAATRIGAEYARDSSACSIGTTGINLGATPPTIATACTDGIASAIKNAFAYGTALTVITPTQTSTGLACYCDDRSSIGCGSSTVCASPPKRVLIKVSASQAITPILSWPGFPTTLNGVTEIRLQ